MQFRIFILIITYLEYILWGYTVKVYVLKSLGEVFFSMWLLNQLRMFILVNFQILEIVYLLSSFWFSFWKCKIFTWFESRNCITSCIWESYFCIPSLIPPHLLFSTSYLLQISTCQYIEIFLNPYLFIYLFNCIIIHCVELACILKQPPADKLLGSIFCY